MAMNRILPLSVLALALAGCGSFLASGEASPGAGGQAALNPQSSRITDRRILADRQTLESVQQRLRALNEGGIPQGSYPLAKAQCWLDTAKSQYHENDRTGYIEASLAESITIVQALEADKTAQVGLETPLVARSTRLRPDLWAALAQYKSQASTLSCTARTVACAEVRLVRAGHAEEQTGWRQATPHVQMVEDALRVAAQEAASCPPALSAAAAVAPVAPVAPASAVQTLTRETYVILADALFQFDKSRAEDMLPGGRQRLADVAQRLKGYQSIQTLTIAGHTDRLGDDAYNDRLSQARADTVKAYLASLGVQAQTVQARGVGEREPVTQNCADAQPRAALIQCLQADRRVTIEVTGVVK
jgi:outer membrane protein OmpA-like peptidoglycan-associated protein